MKSTLGSSFFIQTSDKYSATSIVRQINADTLERRSCWQMMRLGKGKKKRKKKKKKKKRLGEGKKKSRKKGEKEIGRGSW